MTQKLIGSTLHASSQPSRLSRAWKAVTNKIGNVLAERIVTLATSAILVSGCGDRAARNLTDAQTDSHADAQGEIYDGEIGKQDAGNQPCKNPNGIEWAVTYKEGTESWGRDIVTNSDGNVYAIGITHYPTNRDIWIRKMNSDGKELQIQPINVNTFWDDGWGVATNSSGNLYFTGENNDEFLLVRKTDPTDLNQKIIWEWRYNSFDPDGNAIKVDNEGNVYVIGDVFVWDADAPNSFSKNDILVAKLDDNGNALWTRIHDGPAKSASWDSGQGITVDSNGNVYAIGVEQSDIGNQIWIRKFDSQGNELWTKRYPDGYGSGIVADRNDHIYVTGSTFDIDDLTTNLWIRKLDTDGNELWPTPIIGTGSSIHGSGIAVDSANNIYVTGQKYMDGRMVVWTQKMNPDGEEIWTRTYNDDRNGIGRRITLAPDGSVYVVGITQPEERWRALILKYCNP